jgi:hypothetical protein
VSDSRSTETNFQATAARDAVNPLRREFAAWQTLFEAQPGLVQRFIEAQGRVLGEALGQREAGSQLRFTLPDRVVLVARATAGDAAPLVPVPPEFREQLAGGLIDRLTRSSLALAVRQRLGELEQSPNRAVAVSAGLLRFATSEYLVHGLLPSGRTVQYTAAEGEEIPSLPMTAGGEPESAITASTDAIAEEPGDVKDGQGDAALGVAEAGRGELQVPFVPAARRFYLPQWVAFDAGGQLLVNSVSQAEAHVASMQRFLAILHMAISLAPYVVADEVYQQKRYGMLGQLVNQGRALAIYRTSEIVQTIWRRAKAQDLNRGLSVSLPYFDDQDLRLRSHSFEIIPAGRIMFVPAFVVRAAIAEQAKVAQDTRLSLSTRRHLLAELRQLEAAFALPEDR